MAARPLVARVVTRLRNELTGRLRPDLEGAVRAVHPAHANTILTATNDVVALLAEQDNLDYLATNSPGLLGCDWDGYLRASTIRVANLVARLEARGVKPGARILDYGAYFGNFSLTLARLGYDVCACDGYSGYNGVFAPNVALLQREGVECLDSTVLGYELKGVPPGSFDAVFSMGVIEHIPHTPREYLHTLNRFLKQGGVLVMDTPNIAYQANRDRLNRGESIHPAIELQFVTEIPFVGHHREYTAAELRWMLGQIGHESIEIDYFDYSMYLLSQLEGDEMRAYKERMRTPGIREVLVSSSVKSAAPA